MKVSSGVTRLVFIFKNFVIKVPNPRYGWRYVLRGLLGNDRENKTWKYNSGQYERGLSHLLCPVIWCSWAGLLLLMKRAETVEYRRKYKWIGNTDDVIRRKKDLDLFYKKWIEAGFGGDDQHSNYGYYAGQIVKIDYADLDNYWGSDFEKIKGE